MPNLIKHIELGKGYMEFVDGDGGIIIDLNYYKGGELIITFSSDFRTEIEINRENKNTIISDLKDLFEKICLIFEHTYNSEIDFLTKNLERLSERYNFEISQENRDYELIDHLFFKPEYLEYKEMLEKLTNEYLSLKIEKDSVQYTFIKRFDNLINKYLNLFKDKIEFYTR